MANKIGWFGSAGVGKTYLMNLLLWASQDGDENDDAIAESICKDERIEDFLLPCQAHDNLHDACTVVTTRVMYGEEYGYDITYKSPEAVLASLAGFDFNKARQNQSDEYNQYMLSLGMFFLRHKRARVEGQNDEDVVDDGEEMYDFTEELGEEIDFKKWKEPEPPYELSKRFRIFTERKTAKGPRVEIRNALRALLTHQFSRYLIEEVRVFAPSEFLANGTEWLDAPGSNQNNPVIIDNLVQATRDCDHVMCFRERVGYVDHFVRRYYPYVLLGGQGEYGNFILLEKSMYKRSADIPIFSDYDVKSAIESAGEPVYGAKPMNLLAHLKQNTGIVFIQRYLKELMTLNDEQTMSLSSPPPLAIQYGQKFMEVLSRATNRKRVRMPASEALKTLDMLVFSLIKKESIQGDVSFVHSFLGHLTWRIVSRMVVANSDAEYQEFKRSYEQIVTTAGSNLVAAIQAFVTAYGEMEKPESRPVHPNVDCGEIARFKCQGVARSSKRMKVSE